MTTYSSVLPTFPRLTTNQPITYTTQNEYKIIFHKKPHSILKADIYVPLNTESELKLQIYHIIQRITNECHLLNIKPEHALNAIIQVSPSFPNFPLLLKEIATNLNTYHSKYYWSSSSEGIYCTPKYEAFLSEPYSSPSEIYKY
jgi:hypothetical protein